MSYFVHLIGGRRAAAEIRGPEKLKHVTKTEDFPIYDGRPNKYQFISFLINSCVCFSMFWQRQRVLRDDVCVM